MSSAGITRWMIFSTTSSLMVCWVTSGLCWLDTTTASTATSSPSERCTVVPPASFGVWPFTITPVRMAIFFFLKLRTTTLATSLSSPGRIFGSA